MSAHKHKTLATLRRDGSPRISGTEMDLFDGDLWFGSMLHALKARDLLRDPRFALHGATVDEELTGGDAKIAGRAVEITDPAEFERFVKARNDDGAPIPDEPFHLFRLDVTEVVLIRIGDPADHLLIESWHEGKGLTSVKRR